jgi:molecular chaperone DnaK
MKDKAGEVVSFEGDIGRAEYEAVVADLIETTIGCCTRALARSHEVASVGVEEIDHVILVGGSTRVPLVVRRVTEALCKRSPEPLRDDVDTCVALGAAVHAAHVGGTLISDQGAKVRITTPLVAQGDKLRLGLTIEEAPKNAAHLALWEGEKALAESALPKDKGAPLKFEIPLGEAEDTHATLAFQTSVGAPLAELPVSFHRGDLRPRPTALSRASVVAKDLSLEVVRGGKRERKVLIARGTGLPTQVTQLFFTADQSGAVVLRILQNRLPIKTLVVDVPRELPVGSPVEVVLRCDESMRLEAQATVGAQQIQAHIEPPQTASLGDVNDVEALLDRADKARRALWGGLGHEFSREADRLVVAIREVIHTDPDKLEALCQRLSHLVEELHGGAGEQLVPPMQRMEDEFDSLRRVVYRAQGSVMGMSREEWEKRIDALYDKAMAAHAAGDGPTWRRVYNEVQALSETAWQEEFSQMRLDDPAYVQRRMVQVTWRAKHAAELLAEIQPSTTEEIRQMQVAEQARITKWISDSVDKPLAKLREKEKDSDVNDVRRGIDAINAELERIEAAVERLPSIGLVTDRGAG